MLTTAKAGLIERTGVTGLIIGGLEGGSVLLIAGAGYGKTTALRQALDRSGSAAAWVRCGDAGADAGRLLGLVLDAVARACPGAADAIAEQLGNAREPIDPERATAALEHELGSVLLEPLVIVFDDAETVMGAPAALGVIGRLLASESPTLRVALAARQRPDVRLARVRVTGRITELGPSDLAFSAPECAAYLRQAIGQDPDPAEVEGLLLATDGWPLGIALTASEGDLRAFGPSPAVAREYFAEEIYSPMDPRLRQSLLAASIAPDLQVAELAGLAPQGGFAGAIDRRELFVRSESGDGPRELHPLFREFLRARFRTDVPPDEQRLVARQIARALDAADRRAEAVDYYVSGEDWAMASAGVAREGAALVRSAADTVDGWIRALPDEHADRPELRLLAGELAHGQGRFREAVDLCRSAVEAFDAAGAPAAQRFAARFALADVLMAVGDLSSVGALSSVLDEPGAAGNVLARAVGIVAAAGLARAGRFAEGRSVFDRALDDPSAGLLQGLAPAFAGYYLELPAGRLDDALRHAHDAVAMLEVADPTGRLPYALTYLMAILEERGEDSEALVVAQRTREGAQRVGLAGWVGLALAIRSASLRVRSGDAAGAETDLADVPRQWEAWGAWELDATRASIAALRGDGEQALAAAERAVREVDRRWPYFDRARCAALLAPTLSNAGHSLRAREVVEQTLAGRQAGFSTARLNAVLAWLLHDEGDEQGSIAALSAACQEAGDQFKHVIRREWPRIERPVWAALEQGALDVAGAVEALAGARSGGTALAGFTRHPSAAVRRAALLSAVVAGHPDGIERVPELLRDNDERVVIAARAAADFLTRTPPTVSFRVLGGFEVRRGTWLVDDVAWGRRVAQRVIRLLLCRAGGPVPEDELIEAFWPDKTPQAARRGIQVAVSAARAVLDPPGVEHSRLVCSERTYRLRLREDDTIDAEEFERAAKAAFAVAPGACRPALLAAAALWGGEPLPEERYTEWAALWRERLVDRYAEVLAALSEAHEQAGEMSQAVEVARRLVELDPLNEAAHRRLMVAFARAGRRGHALRQFLACRHALITELAIEPGEDTAALQRRLLAGESI